MKFIKILSCLCVFILCACSKAVMPPKKVAAYFLDAYKTADEEQLEMYSTWKDYHVDAQKMQESDYIEGVDKALQEQVFNMMMDFDYEVKDESIKDDNGSVQVDLTVYDFDAVRDEALKKAEEKATEISSKEDVNDAQAQVQIMTVMYEHMVKAEKTKHLEISLNVEKVSGKWLVNSNNADIQNVLLDNINMMK